MKRIALLLGCLLAPLFVLAQVPEQFDWQEFGKRIKRSEAISPHGPDVVGDQVSLSNGALSFKATDVSLPGNDGLPVQFTRGYSMINRKDYSVSDGMLADWQVEAPSINAVFAPNWVVGLSASTNRCSSADIPVGTTPFTSKDFWQGLNIELPGGGGELLRTSAGTTRPSTGGPWLWVTNDQTHVSCLPTIKNGSGEGFYAVTSDGTKYWFDWMAQTAEPRSRSLEATQYTMVAHILNRKKNWLYATRVEDRFGNFVTYTYANSWNEPGKLTQIAASDGRAISIAYTNNRVSSVSNGTHAWSYVYGTTPGGRATLTGVTLPDLSKWSIGFNGFTDAEIQYAGSLPGEPARSCEVNELPMNYTAQPTASITHPSGAHAVFVMDIREHGRSSVPVSCSNVKKPYNDPGDDVNMWATAAYSFTLKKKTLSGPGLPAAVWDYSYIPNNSTYKYPGTTAAHPVCDWVKYDCSQPPCTTASCARASITIISGPGTDWARYHHGNTYRYNEGKLLRVDTGVNFDGVNILRTVWHVYDLAKSQVGYPIFYGVSQRESGEGFGSQYHRPLLATTTNLQGHYVFETNKSFNQFAQPVTVLRQGNNGDYKTESIAYAHNYALWVIGQVVSVACVDSSLAGCSGEIPAAVTYDPLTAKPLTFSAFGQLQQTLIYDTTSPVNTGQRGTVWKVKNSNNYSTTLTNWYRGIARTVTHPDGYAKIFLVSPQGWITQVTDELANVTGYGYDSMGRVSSVTWPVGDSTAWLGTARIFEKIAAAEYGIPGNHWRLTETTGNTVKITYFDALWQPLLVREYDSSEVEKTQRFIKREFDIGGRETFVSYPSANSVPAKGVWSAFDVLGRGTSVSQDSELGLLTAVTMYQGFIAYSTNPRGVHTATFHHVLDGPSYDFPVVIKEPGGVTKTISRDAYGKPLSIKLDDVENGTALSVTRNFVYDAQRRLCKRVDPESGATIVEYDAAGNVAWTARSSTLASISDCQRTSVPVGERSARSYDSRNRLIGIDHPLGTADDSYTYYSNSALKTAGNTGGGIWTYTYNKRRLPTGESLSIDSRNFTLSYGCSGLGHMNSLTYPSGLSVAFNPNALGQERQAGSYANAATYYPDNSMQGFTYGNGVVHSRSRNERGLPLRITDSYGNAKRLDHTFYYDKNANVTQINDGVDSKENRFLSYDARDRMVTATAPNMYGEEIYEYDPLDNVSRSAMFPDGGGGYLLDYRYVYDTNQRLDRINNPASVPQWDFSHNGVGETVSRSGGGNNWAYSWNAAGRMTQAGSESYVYDAHGHRTRTLRTNPGTSRYQIYSRAGQLLYTEDTRENERADYVYLAGRLVAQRNRPIGSNTVTDRYHHTDNIGSASVETSSTGVALQRTFRTPYGQPYSGTYREGPGYAGHVTDKTTGLTYMQQRYYDPVALRFFSVDPVDVSAGNGANFNRYWYANNNPYRFVDPDGRYICSGTESNCANFKDALARVEKASGSERLNSEQRTDLKNVVKFYGKEGDDNVSVSFKSPGYVQGTATLGADGKAEIQLVPGKSILHHARDVLHEGSHGVDDRARGRIIATRAERKETERRAYTVQAHFQNAEEFSTSSKDGWTLFGGYSNQNIERQAEASVNGACRGETEGSCR